MKKRSIISAFLALVLTASVFSCTNASGDSEVHKEQKQESQTETNPEAENESEAENGSQTGEGAILSFDFVDYEDGIVNGVDSGILEHTEKDGKRVLKITPNPSTEATRISIDGYSYASAGIDLNLYRWAAIEYYYESPTPVEDNMYLGVLKNGGVFNSSIDRVSADSREKIVSGKWSVVTFDLRELEHAVVKNSENVFARQMHIRPFRFTPVQELTKDDVMYISRIMFFEKEPELISHEAYMNGYEDGTFRPAGTMTRAEACTVIARLLEKEENISGASSFEDVSADVWYAKYIGYCANRGLLTSYSGTFLPDQAITRAEFAELVYLTGLAADGASDVSFSDVDESHPKYASIKAAAGAGLINGYDEADGTYTFKPDNTITRAEVVTVINRATGTSKKQEQLTAGTVKLFVDVDDTHWAFADIAEAVVPHYESGGVWAFTTLDPVAALAEKVGYGAIYDFDKTNKKLAELDALEAKRIEEIRNTPNMDLSNIKGNKIYVSSSTGNDSNNGLSPDSPVKTINRATALVSPNGAVLFRRGDMWRAEQIEARDGVTYTAYGEGAKPLFYGSPKNAADETLWSLVYEDKETGALIWLYKEQNLGDIGTFVFNGGEGFAMKEIPSSSGQNFIVRGTKDTPFDYTRELDRNLEFFHCANNVTTTNSAGLEIIDPGKSTGPVYLRCDNGNPGKVFDSIELITRGAVVKVGKASNVTVDNLCLMYSSFGISAGNQKNLTVTNMEIGWIGGNIQTYALYGSTDGRATRYGNGVEVYGSCDGYYIDNCYVYQCYDAGVTHQFSGSSSGDCREDNIRYSNNVITDCVYSIEYFLGVNSSNPDFVREGENVLFENNLCRRAGFGFGSFRPDANNQRHIRSGSGNNFRNFVIRNNVFDRAVEELTRTTVSSSFPDAEPVYDGNVYIQGVNNILFSSGVSKSAKTDLLAKKSIEAMLGDTNCEVYYTDYIPKYTFSYVPSKTAPVTEDDRRVFPVANPTALTPEPDEGKEVTAPLHIEVQKDKDIYREVRKSTTLEVKTDEKTGIVYNEVTLIESGARIMLDCYGISPAIPLENSYLYVKLLMRTNKSIKPNVNVYGLKDENGVTVSASIGDTALTSTKGKGEWEEVIIKISGIPSNVASTSQLHVNYGGSKAATTFFKDGVTDAKFDIAGWAVFENLASAQAFDIKSAAAK